MLMSMKHSANDLTVVPGREKGHKITAYNAKIQYSALTKSFLYKRAHKNSITDFLQMPYFQKKITRHTKKHGVIK